MLGAPVLCYHALTWRQVLENLLPAPALLLRSSLRFGFDDGDDAGGTYFTGDEGPYDGGHGAPGRGDGAAGHSPGKALQGLVL